MVKRDLMMMLQRTIPYIELFMSAILLLRLLLSLCHLSNTYFLLAISLAMIDWFVLYYWSLLLATHLDRSRAILWHNCLVGSCPENSNDDWCILPTLRACSSCRLLPQSCIFIFMHLVLGLLKMSGCSVTRASDSWDTAPMLKLLLLFRWGILVFFAVNRSRYWENQLCNCFYPYKLEQA